VSSHPNTDCAAAAIRRPEFLYPLPAARIRIHPAMLFHPENFLSAAAVFPLIHADRLSRSLNESWLDWMHITTASCDPVPNIGKSSPPGSPDLLFQHFFDLPDLFLNFAADVFGLAFSLHVRVLGGLTLPFTS
jgi:hypothetical protein